MQLDSIMNFARKTECATLAQEQNQTFHAEATVYDLAAWVSNQPFHSLQCSLVFCFRVSHCANASSGVTPGFLNSKKAAKSIGTAFHFRATLCLATKDSRNRQISNLDQRPFRSLCRLAYVWPSIAFTNSSLFLPVSFQASISSFVLPPFLLYW